MHKAIINFDAKIGDNCIINTEQSLNMMLPLRIIVMYQPVRIINGGVKIGAGSFIGSGTTIRENKSIKKFNYPYGKYY